MKFKSLRYALAVISNAPSQYVITDGQWGSPNVAVVPTEDYARLFTMAPTMLQALKNIVQSAPLKGLPLALELDIQSACHLIKAIEAEGDK
jgi:hypothetical protein